MKSEVILQKYRITPDEILPGDLGAYDIFVFGSNESGRHGAGAAAFALENCGAKNRQGFGHAGNSFAIPTKDWTIQTLPLETIKFYVDRFIEFVKPIKGLNFYVTQIGCGFAGYTPEEIAPLFLDVIKLENVFLPQSFWDVFEKNDKTYKNDVLRNMMLGE